MMIDWKGWLGILVVLAAIGFVGGLIVTWAGGSRDAPLIGAISVPVGVAILIGLLVGWDRLKGRL